MAADSSGGRAAATTKTTARRGHAAPGVVPPSPVSLLANRGGRDGPVLVLGIDLRGTHHRLDALEAGQAVARRVAVHLDRVSVGGACVLQPIELLVRHPEVVPHVRLDRLEL